MSASMFERIAAVRESGDLDALSQAIPYARWLGLSARVDNGSVLVTMKFADHIIGNPALPALHGGTLGALLESAAIFELLWSSETIVLPKTITITIDYRGPSDSFRLYLKTFDSRYSKASDGGTNKYNQIELPLHNGRQTIQAKLGDMKVPDWWLQSHRLPYRLSHAQFDNVVSLEIDTGNNAPVGHHSFHLEGATLAGRIVPVEQWYLGILGVWIILICLFTISRILGLQRDLRRRHLLEQVARGEAQLARETARRDHLTSLYNRRGVTERYQQMLAESPDKPIAIMIADIDHFKTINDRHGHVVGDEVLAAFAELLRKSVRDTDLVARWGGEEFLLIGHVHDAHAAVDVANKLRTKIEATEFPHGSLTASFGVYYCDRLPEKVRPAIGFADRALYAAKEGGRNRVVLYETSTDAAPARVE